MRAADFLAHVLVCSWCYGNMEYAYGSYH
jgi:hypothetical protein